MKRLVLLFFFILFPLCFVGFGFSSETVSLGQADLKVYIIALNGVSAHGVGNITETVRGAADACVLSSALDSIYSYLYGGRTASVKISPNVTILSNWENYRQVVETGEEVIVVNAHGETLPVPSNFTWDAWVDTIAEGMMNRRLTWVHTAGYPFYYAWQQGADNETVTGEAGFKRLMSHIGLGDVTCSYDRTDVPILLNPYISSNWGSSWPMIGQAYYAERGRPLSVADFANYTVLPIWTGETADAGWMAGAMVDFVKPSERLSGLFGSYVHIGTYATYVVQGNQKVPTNGDYLRGYIGVAISLGYDAWRVAAEHTISAAQVAVAKAEGEGRTSGLSDARQLLQRVETCVQTMGQTEEYSQYSMGVYWGTAALLASDAETAAINATVPTQSSTLQPLLAISLAGMAAAGGLGVIEGCLYKRKHEKK